jgi:hypothetical protein
MGWTTPGDVKAQLERRWNRGHLLVPPAGEPLFPLPVRFSRPDTRSLSERFEEVRSWIRDLEAGSKAHLGHGYEIRWAEINHRQLGTNRVPVGAIVPTLEDAVALIGKRRAADRWRILEETTARACPPLLSWVRKNPLTALDSADDWGALLAVVAWFTARPRPGIYLRQVDIPGVDTKFIEARHSLIAELLDATLPAEAVLSAASPSRQFELRYGLLVKPSLVRFRILDERMSIQGLSDIATPAAQFARLSLPVRRVFVTENEINGLAFPALPESIVVFGLGYGLDRLSEISWWRDREIYYWGDIDTHGFAILDRLREALPRARSLLMDRDTLMAHRALWGAEPEPHLGALSRLTEPERALFEDLRLDRLGPRVRLEQERISYSWLRDALCALTDEP